MRRNRTINYSPILNSMSLPRQKMNSTLPVTQGLETRESSRRRSLRSPSSPTTRSWSRASSASWTTSIMSQATSPRDRCNRSPLLSKPRLSRMPSRTSALERRWGKLTLKRVICWIGPSLKCSKSMLSYQVQPTKASRALNTSSPTSKSAVVVSLDSLWNSLPARLSLAPSLIRTLPLTSHGMKTVNSYRSTLQKRTRPMRKSLIYAVLRAKVSTIWSKTTRPLRLS